MSAQEAKDYGLVDEVVKSRKEVPGPIRTEKMAEKLLEKADKPETAVE